ncbi:MAG: IbrB-like domain-containing protein [Desulfotomaculales bacterium]
MKQVILSKVKEAVALLKECDLEERIEILNEIKKAISQASPFEEPVDLVKWVKAEKVVGNDYNPNQVAPPEMKLLEISIMLDGYTQPIVTYYDAENDRYIVVDGFHRHRVGKENQEIYMRLNGYLPVVVIDKDLGERMASTIRHNRARGTHAILPMSKIVEELYFMGWSDKKIAEQLGMDKDEVLRLKQFTGLGNLFKDREYSKSWVWED